MIRKVCKSAEILDFRIKSFDFISIYNLNDISSSLCPIYGWPKTKLVVQF